MTLQLARQMAGWRHLLSSSSSSFCAPLMPQATRPLDSLSSSADTGGTKSETGGVFHPLTVAMAPYTRELTPASFFTQFPTASRLSPLGPPSSSSSPSPSSSSSSYSSISSTTSTSSFSSVPSSPVTYQEVYGNARKHNSQLHAALEKLEEAERLLEAGGREGGVIDRWVHWQSQRGGMWSVRGYKRRSIRP
jgi:hypothetical protein